jgi:hypothetical protein
MRGLGYGYLLIRVKLGFALGWIGLGWIGCFNNFWITPCNFSGIPLLSPSIHRKWALKGSSFTLDHSLWITLGITLFGLYGFRKARGSNGATRG